MRKLIAITDLTEMWASEVCIAGVTEELECIRPMIEGGVQQWDLIEDDVPIIFPGAKIWMDFSPAQIIPPHIEDSVFNPETIEFKGAFEGRHWETLLQKTASESVQAIFDGELKERRVAPRTKTRSLGTIEDVTILDLAVDARHNKIGLRIDFEDASGEVHRRFPVNDLAFRRMFSQLMERSRATTQAAANDLMSKLKRADRVYLRIGLARPAKVGDHPESCWVQVTGVYTFTDYLDGRNWADFE